MLRAPLLLLLSVLFATISFAQQAWQPGEVLVLLSKEARPDDVHQELVRQLPAGTVLQGMEQLGRAARYHKLVVQGTGLDDRGLEQAVARIPGVEAVSLNYVLKYNAQPNDTQFGTQWGMQDINVEPVWDFTTGGAMANGKRIAVAISDEAIETTHPDLLDNIWPGSPHLGSGAFHGTAVASVVGAVGNNGQGIAGVNWDVDIVSSAAAFDLSDIIEVFEHALFVREQFNGSNGASGALVVSVTASWGAPGIQACDGFSDPLFHDMALAGILVITSGPNDPVDLDVAPEYPSSCALAEHLVVSTIGQAGQTPFAIGDNSVHLLAPGLDIPVADELNGYQLADGNSFAIPHVAGAIALLYSVPCAGFADLVMDDPQAARTLVKNAILNNTAPVPGGNAITITGGKLDVFAAYQALMAQCPVCDTLTVHLSTPAGSTAQYNLLNGSGNSIEQGTGDAIQFCAAEGCFTASVVDGASQPLNGTFTVEFLGATVQSGSIVNGALSFDFGTVTPGCTSPGAVNYNASANCDDGTCCSTAHLQIVIPAADPQSTGQLDAVVVIAGDTVFNGTLAIAPNVVTGPTSAAVLGLCYTPGCMSVTITNATTALFSESILSLTNSGGTNNTFFSTGDGFLGSLETLQELCDGVDNDCDGLVDEDFLWFPDSDGDGFGANVFGTVSCTPLAGSAQIPGDCDDNDPLVNPGVLDDCATADGIDNNCDGQIDEGDAPAWFADTDQDGFGDDATFMQACTQPPGMVAVPGDCDDANSSVHFGAPELCDGLDNDCDGELDEDFLWFPDADGDGFGASDAEAVVNCIQPPGTAPNNGDCNDAATTVFPGGTEVCDGLDNDCDGAADEGFVWFMDADADGFGDPATAQFSCIPLPGLINTGGDCNDTNAAITVPGTPCDDGNAATIGDIVLATCICQGFNQGSCPPGETEDCNGNCAPVEWVGDDICDEGSFDWNENFIFLNCPALGNDGGDCADPCGQELCDGQDNDCDGLVDEVFFWYADTDGDGYGDDATGQFSCTPLPGLTNIGGDCNDNDAAVHPGATEVCDGLDNNCDGITDGTTVDFQSGCTNPMACNYDPNAICPDASCVQGSIADGNGTFATDFTATDVNGNTVNLFALLAQGKTVILDFFTTWCLPSNQMNSAGLLQDWYAHMGPDSLDLIRFVSLEIEDTATVTGSLAPFVSTIDWPIINNGGGAIMQQYAALGLYNGFVPTLVMICPDRSAQRIYAQPDELPYSTNFIYDPAAALTLINEKCGCRGVPCLANIGCMDVTACNYDPAATCPGPCTQAQEWFGDNDGDGYGTGSLGSACTQPANAANISGDCDDNDPAAHTGFTLLVLTEDPGAFGTAHYLIQQGGTLIEGDLDLPAETEGIGALPVCIGDGCYSITISQNDVPLWVESYLQFPDAPNDPVVFFTNDGYEGNTSTEVCDGVDNDCDGQVDEGCPMLLNARVFLEGPYNSGAGTMNDGMRSLGLVPTVEPYSGLGYTHLGGGGESTTSGVLAVTGDDAIVDWVIIELRDSSDPATILGTRSALLQRDGDVVDVDGASPVSFVITSANYHVAVLHRNHLGCMTAGPVALSPTVASVDFTSSATGTFGTNARKGAGPVQLLWAGDVTFNQMVKYTGAANDRDPILVRVGSTTPNNAVTGYHREDVNLNGQVKYTGSANDRDPILVNVGSTTPNSVRQAQLP